MNETTLTTPAHDHRRIDGWDLGGKIAAMVTTLGIVTLCVVWADQGPPPDELDASAAAAWTVTRIFGLTFAAFCGGLISLFMYLVIRTVVGELDLAAALRDKAEGAKGTGGISLGRVQAFMWTLIVMTAYFHEVVSDQKTGLPEVPPSLLAVMGISGALYVTSKTLGNRGGSSPPPTENATAKT